MKPVQIWGNLMRKHKSRIEKIKKKMMEPFNWVMLLLLLAYSFANRDYIVIRILDRVLMAIVLILAVFIIYKFTMAFYNVFSKENKDEKSENKPNLNS